jgi:hypothetical protein
MKEGRTCSRHGEGRDVYRILVGKSEGRRPRRRWKDNIMMDLRDIVIDVVNWIRLAQDRVRWRTIVSMLMNL